MPTFRVAALVRVVEVGKPDSQVWQDFVLDDAFDASQTSLVGTALQRGIYEAFISAFNKLSVPSLDKPEETP